MKKWFTDIGNCGNLCSVTMQNAECYVCKMLQVNVYLNLFLLHTIYYDHDEVLLYRNLRLIIIFCFSYTNTSYDIHHMIHNHYSNISYDSYSFLKCISLPFLCILKFLSFLLVCEFSLAVGRSIHINCKSYILTSV